MILTDDYELIPLSAPEGLVFTGKPGCKRMALRNATLVYSGRATPTEKAVGYSICSEHINKKELAGIISGIKQFLLDSLEVDIPLHTWYVSEHSPQTTYLRLATQVSCTHCISMWIVRYTVSSFGRTLNWVNGPFPDSNKAFLSEAIVKLQAIHDSMELCEVNF